MPHNMANFGPLAAEIGFGVWSTPAYFNGFASGLRYWSDVIHRRPTKFCMMFGVSWAATLCIHFWVLLPADRILPSAKFTLRPSLAFFYIGSVTARHSSSGHQSNFAACYKEWNYATLAEGTTYIRQGRAAITLSIGPHSSELWVSSHRTSPPIDRYQIILLSVGAQGCEQLA